MAGHFDTRTLTRRDDALRYGFSIVEVGREPNREVPLQGQIDKARRILEACNEDPKIPLPSMEELGWLDRFKQKHPADYAGLIKSASPFLAGVPDDVIVTQSRLDDDKEEFEYVFDLPGSPSWEGALEPRSRRLRREWSD